MTWVKLDDGFAEHPKILSLSDGAYRAFVDGLCYCARQLTDGHITNAAVQRLGAKRVMPELVKAGLWHPNGDGVNVHDYLEFQPSSAQIRQRRASDSARKRNGTGAES